MEGCLPMSSIYTPGEYLKDTSNPATISDATTKRRGKNVFNACCNAQLGKQGSIFNSRVGTKY